MLPAQSRDRRLVHLGRKLGGTLESRGKGPEAQWAAGIGGLGEHRGPGRRTGKFLRVSLSWGAGPGARASGARRESFRVQPRSPDAAWCEPARPRDAVPHPPPAPRRSHGVQMALWSQRGPWHRPSCPR